MRIFLDPWDSEYTVFFQVEEEQELKDIKLDVELPKESWHPIRVRETYPISEVMFLDGVRRMHQRVVIEKDGEIFYGGFGTYVAGALKLVKGQMNDMSSSLLEVSIKRTLILPEKIGLSSKEFDLPGLPFPVEVKYIKDNEPQAPLKKLQDLMRTEEVTLADYLLSFSEYRKIPLVVDGTLYFSWKNAKVLGFIKSLHNLYLPYELLSMVMDLKEGERTPIFLISFKNRELTQKYSWFLRLKSIGEKEFPYAGIVRIEAPGLMERDEVFSLADWSLSLSFFISDRMRDKRSPQNLLPVGVLEKELKKRIGNEYLIAQRIRVFLEKEIF